MARRVIELRWPATCRDCGAALMAGDRARYYGRGRVYGLDCHEQKDRPERKRRRRENGRQTPQVEACAVCTGRGHLGVGSPRDQKRKPCPACRGVGFDRPFSRPASLTDLAEGFGQ
jgi:DnaJ-class molecular chaperone